MDYPNDFDIPSFPAGKTIALSRSVSTWILIVFFLIIASCGLIYLGTRLKTNYPFLISIDPFTEEWSVVTYPGKTQKETVSQYQIVQEKLVRDFVTNWFTLSNDVSENEERWERCDTYTCDSSEQFNPDNTKCALSCKASSAVFENFATNVLPEYRARVQASETWKIARMLITPESVSPTISTWQVVATVQSSINSLFQVLIFITTTQNQDLYPATFGYNVSAFNSYRIENE